LCQAPGPGYPCDKDASVTRTEDFVSADTTRERHALDQVTDRLSRSFADRFSPTQVDLKVSTIHHRFDGRPIREFVPVLVERIARDELRHNAPARH
jgi:hypothetical protein